MFSGYSEVMAVNKYCLQLSVDFLSILINVKSRHETDFLQFNGYNCSELKVEKDQVGVENCEPVCVKI